MAQQIEGSNSARGAAQRRRRQGVEAGPYYPKSGRERRAQLEEDVQAIIDLVDEVRIEYYGGNGDEDGAELVPDAPDAPEPTD